MNENEFVEPRSERSARAVALGALWISRTLSALVIACPVVLAIRATGLASGPEHDAPLFEPGALILMEGLRLGGAALGAAWRVAALSLACSSLGGLLTLGTVLGVLREKTALFLGRKALRGAQLWPRFVGLLLIAGLTYAALFLACSLLGGALGSVLRHADERVETLAPFAIFGLGLLGAFVIAAVHDVARAVVVEHDAGARTALVEALALLRARPAAVLLGFYPSATAAICGWLVAAALLVRIDLTSGREIALAFVVHQFAILLGLGFRVRWLELALELTADSARQ